MDTVTPPRILTGLEKNYSTGEEAGSIVLTWSTSVKQTQQIETTPGEFEDVEMTKSCTVTEAICCGTVEELESAFEHYRRLLGVRSPEVLAAERLSPIKHPPKVIRIS